MRDRGILTEWNDSRGFGFITPGDGGERIFVHVSAFPRGRRPLANDEITYELGRDARNRVSASDVLYVLSDRVRRKGPRGLPTALAAAALFFGLLAGLVAWGRIPVVLMAGYAVLSLGAFTMYRADKAAAERGEWRIKETTLHTVDLVGGWPGGLVARRLLRHKTRKQPFRALFWGSVAANCAVLAWLVYEQPTWLG